MDMTASGKSQATLEEKLSSYRELCDLRQQLGDRMRKLEESRETVSERIYEKVQGEYREELSKIDTDLEPLKGEIENARVEVEKEMDAIAQGVAALEDELSEADLRHRIGEYTDAQIAEFRRRVEPRLEEERERALLLENRVTAFHERRSADRASEAAAPPPPTPTPRPTAPAPAPAPTARPAPPAAAAPVEEPAGDDFAAFPDPPAGGMENPHDWADETPSPAPAAAERRKSVPEPAPDPTATAVEDPEDDDDPLAALADPTTEKRPPVNPGKPGASTGQPVLQITTGPHADKTIPLLPMTMTIGREHDNNIELKDPDVARYHARIIYESGQYVIEDLEGASGTLVNGERVVRTPLEDGDHVQIGQTMLVFSRD